MPHVIDHHRRHFFGIAAGTLAAGLAVTSAANAQSGDAKPAKIAATKPGTNTSFGPLKQIDAGLLNVGYAETGPAKGPAAILLHGWPYDIHSFVDVAPMLAQAGYRVIVPYLFHNRHYANAEQTAYASTDKLLRVFSLSVRLPDKVCVISLSVED
jgi:predicted dienelactone hydrolase